MAIPEGYVSLGLVGFTDKGDYSPDAVYVQNDLVHQDNAIWKCLIDGTTGIPPSSDSENWTIYIRSQTRMDGITVTDTFGIMGETGEVVVAQSFLDLLAEKIMNQMLTKNGLVNNALATVPGVAALDSVMGATLQSEIDQTNSNLGTTNSKLTSTTNTVNKINKFYGNSLSFINERSGPATLDLIVELTGNNGVCGIDAGVAKPFFPEAHYYICYVNRSEEHTSELQSR